MRPISGKAALAGVIGWPVSHSLSPRLHGHWLERHGIDGAYVPLAVAPDRLETAVRGLAALGFKGFNVTLPHKEAILPLLDIVDEQARAIGAVNTVVIRPDGTLHGSNTDAYGFIENLRASCPALEDKLKRVAVLGAGGAARAVVASLLDAGAKHITLMNRTVSRAQAIALEFNDPRLEGATLAEPEEDVTLVVNTTSAGIGEEGTLPVTLGKLRADALVTDIVYSPPLTPFLKLAQARGLHTVDGLGMLIHQAVPGFSQWFGVTPAITPETRKALLA